MAYQVLARKWRPQTFAEVVGQEHISRTLKNAIKQNRIGHAYLFVGSRGIGKTTSARIFAKALNCSNNVDGEPCCQCESCRQIASGISMDVIEIDGASHNKVEDIRDIRENVQYTPTNGRFKIYIIDEVHMLTPQAWNALLKTLEEPPEHVKFLFATTEPHKVLPTIVSRCQRFDLKRISVPLITQRLRQIADGEHIHVEESALSAIARAADGGMRDAQSIFDQMIAFCGGLQEGELITEQDVIDVFGLASGMELREIAAGIFTNDINRALLVLQKLADSGRDLERLFGDLVGYVRNIMVAGMTNDPSKILEVSDTELADLKELGTSLDSKLVQRVLQGLVAQEWNFRSAVNKRIYFEAVLARVMLDAHSVQLDDIIRQLNVLNGTLPQLQTPVERSNPFGSTPASLMEPSEGAVTSPKVEQAPPVAVPPSTEEKAVSQRSVLEESPSQQARVDYSVPDPAVAAPVQPVADRISDPAVAAPVQPVADRISDSAVVVPSQVGAVVGNVSESAAVVPTQCCSSVPQSEAISGNEVPQLPVSASVSAPVSAAPSPGFEDSPQSYSQDVPPASFYDTLQPPPDMDDLDAMVSFSSDFQGASEKSGIEEDVHVGMRRPNLDEFEALERHPFVQKVNALFRTVVVDARLKE